MRHLDPIQHPLHAFLALSGAHAAVGQRQFDVLVHREVADEIEGLEDEADATVPNPGALGGLQIRHRFASQAVLAGGRRVEQAEDRQQG